MRSSRPAARPSGSARQGRSSPRSSSAACATSRCAPRPATGARRSDIRAALELWHILRRERPTVLHTHNPKPGLYGRIIGRLAGVPIVVNTVHGLYATPDDPLVRRALVYSLEAFASRWSDVELVQNVEDLELMRRRRLAGARKLRHLGNGVDLRRFSPGLDADRRAELRASWGIDDRTVIVGTVGRLVAEKGYIELFEAVADLAPGVRLVVVGGPDAATARRPGPGGARAGRGQRCRAARPSRRRRRRCSAASTCSCWRRTGKASPVRRWRPPQRGSRSWRRTCAAAVRSSTTGRPGCSCPWPTRTRCAPRSASWPRRRTVGGRWARPGGRRPSASSTSARSCDG